MSKKHFLFLAFILFATIALKAQTKWYQQKSSILPTVVGIDSMASFPRNESGGMIIDFDMICMYIIKAATTHSL